jgi:hypothetical protein
MGHLKLDQKNVLKPIIYTMWTRSISTAYSLGLPQFAQCNGIIRITEESGFDYQHVQTTFSSTQHQHRIWSPQRYTSNRTGTSFPGVNLLGREADLISSPLPLTSPWPVVLFKIFELNLSSRFVNVVGQLKIYHWGTFFWNEHHFISSGARMVPAFVESPSFSKNKETYRSVNELHWKGRKFYA